MTASRSTFTSPPPPSLPPSSQDEWDSDPDDTGMPQNTSHITYYVRGVARTVEVAEDLLQKPTLNRLRNIIQ